MDFGSISFIFIFMPIAAIVYFAIPARNRTARNIALFVLGMLLYAWNSPVNAGIILFITLCSYFCGADIGRRIKNNKPRTARRVMRFAVGVDILILAFFAYWGFFIDSLSKIFKTTIAVKSPGIPIGIGIVTLSAISYVVDIYKGRTQAEEDLINFGIYMTLFPKLIAGPWVSHEKIKFQIRDRAESWSKAGKGLCRFIVGLAKYAIIAATIAGTWLEIRDAAGKSVLTAWIGVIAIAGELYFALSGYSDMAIGLSLIFGFSLPENFNYPYVSKSLAEFERRFCVSVVSWFRTYVLDSIKGRHRVGLNYYIDVLVTGALMGLWFGSVWTVMGTSGNVTGGLAGLLNAGNSVSDLWQGAPSWSYVLGGVFFALMLMLEKDIYGRYLERMPGIVRHLYMMIVAGIGLVFFGCGTPGQAFHYIAAMFGGGGGGFANASVLYYLRTRGLWILIMICSAMPWGRLWKRRIVHERENSGRVLLAAAYIGLFLLCICWIL